MTFQFTTTQSLKSFALAAIFGLGLDAASVASCQLTEFFWFVLRQAVALLFWGALAGWQSSHAQIPGHIFFLGCPLEIVHSLGSLLHFIGGAV
jgi:hypothetical protein